MTGRRGRRPKQLLDDLKEKRWSWKLKEEALDRTLWGTSFGRGYGPVVRQTTEWMSEWTLQLPKLIKKTLFFNFTQHIIAKGRKCGGEWLGGRQHRRSYAPNLCH
jgi:hypothetical protein